MPAAQVMPIPRPHHDRSGRDTGGRRHGLLQPRHDCRPRQRAERADPRCRRRYRHLRDPVGCRDRRPRHHHRGQRRQGAGRHFSSEPMRRSTTANRTSSPPPWKPPAGAVSTASWTLRRHGLPVPQPRMPGTRWPPGDHRRRHRPHTVGHRLPDVQTRHRVRDHVAGAPAAPEGRHHRRRDPRRPSLFATGAVRVVVDTVVPLPEKPHAQRTSGVQAHRRQGDPGHRPIDLDQKSSASPAATSSRNAVTNGTSTSACPEMPDVATSPAGPPGAPARTLCKTPVFAAPSSAPRTA